MRVLSDDRVVIRRIGDGFRAYGTPWPGELGITLNESAPLSAVVFIAHDEANAVVPLAGREALERLLPVTSVPWYDAEVFPHILETLEELAAEVPAFELRYTPGPAVVPLIRELAAGLFTC